jgi:GTP-binding protein
VWLPGAARRFTIGESMHIKSVEFAGAIGRIGQAAPESVRGLSQVAFAGRSNVGKSSLINRILGRTRTQIARVSQQPGKTQEINFYHVRSDLGDFCLVDLPGYGYAKAPLSVRAKWAPLIHGFLRENRNLVGVVQLVDLRHGPSPDDLASLDFLAEIGVPVLFALTKADKLTNTSREKATVATARSLGVDLDQVVPFSSLSGMGRDELLGTLGSLLKTAEDTAAQGATEGDASTGSDRGAGGGGAAMILLALLLGTAALGGGCVAAAPQPSPVAVVKPGMAPEADGEGRLREEEISVELVADGVRLRITPLDPEVLRFSAPDTGQRLRALAAASPAGGSGSSGPFLVTFLASEPGRTFEPGLVELETEGRRLRPESVTPLTSGWSEQRLRPHRGESALYRFDGAVDLAAGWELRYDGMVSDGWRAVRARLDGEAARTGTPLRRITAPDRTP